MPPLLEHIESLLSGTGGDLDLKTFKLVDQLSGRTLGVRADTHAAGGAHRRAPAQPQRRDAAVLLRPGAAHAALGHAGARASRCSSAPRSTATPASRPTSRCRTSRSTACSGAGLRRRHARPGRRAHRARAAGRGVARRRRGRADRRGAGGQGRAELCASSPGPGRRGARRACVALPNLYGDERGARRRAPRAARAAAIGAALDDLASLARHARDAHPAVRVGFDLADVGGYAYYSGARFAVYARGCQRCASCAAGATTRSARSSAATGRRSASASTSRSSPSLVPAAARPRGRSARRGREDAALRAAVRALREQGETVVCVLPGHEHEGQEFDCDRELVAVDGHGSCARCAA